MSEGKVMQTGTTGEQAKTKVGVQGVPETMLQTLFARAAESEKENHHIYDKKAIEIVSQLDYDFSKAESDKLMSSGVIARTIVLDRLVNDCKIREATSKVSRYACIIGHFANAATETIVEVGHSGANQGETKL